MANDPAQKNFIMNLTPECIRQLKLNNLWEEVERAAKELQADDAKAKDILKQLVQMYMVNVDSEGEPTASITEMVELWKKANEISSKYDARY